MIHKKHVTKTTLWIYPGDAAWHFITIPKVLSKELKEMHGKNAKGFGSLPVGSTVWQTSVFPDAKSGTYLLPVKAAVRKVESII
jgi:hypothetical protein